jgi:hypothetical protein
MNTLRQRPLPPAYLHAAWCLAVCATICGCQNRSSNRANVSGKVSLDGKPVTRGSILFVPSETVGGTAAGGAIVDGEYILHDACAPYIGKNRVEIRALRGTGRMVQKPLAPQGDMVDERTEAVASRFNSEATLTFEIQNGNNTASFDVTSQ